MNKVNKQQALDYHHMDGRPGKIEVVPTKPYSSQRDLALAYSPGVAYPCLEIERNATDVYKYTNKGNLVGVISNGTAVLGLGDIGPLAGKPVMEGKALLFKIFAGLDAFDIEVEANTAIEMISAVKAIAPTFGGINLEDIKAPECFEIENALKSQLSIPVMHDDQHGTAIISAAGLINALEIQNKKIGNIKLVVNGAGAAAISCTKLFVALGVKPKNIVMCDSKGVIRSDRKELNRQKKEFATTRNINTLADAMVDADVFLGLSVADVVTPEMLLSMAPRPIVFALANPNPEINYDMALATRKDVIVATGRSDFPNQINNVIGFPYIFRGALDCRASEINENMKIAAVYAISNLAKLPVPSIVDEAYGKNDMHFGKDYILPKPMDPRLLTTVAPAVAKAAMESGVAQAPILDWSGYNDFLHKIMGDNGKVMRYITEKVRNNKIKVVFPNVESDNMLRAAAILSSENILVPVLIGNLQSIKSHAKSLDLDISKIEIIDPHRIQDKLKLNNYKTVLLEKLGRKGISSEDAVGMLQDNTVYATIMVHCGEADALLGAVNSAGTSVLETTKDIIGLKEGFSNYANVHILNLRKGTYFLADTGVNVNTDSNTLVEITRLADMCVRSFGKEPVMAILSYSNFGSGVPNQETRIIDSAIKTLHEKYSEITVDGGMQLNYALETDHRVRQFPFCTLGNRDVNTLIFPNLTSANTTYKMILSQGVGSVIGPIEVGLKQPVFFIHAESSENDIINLATIAALESIKCQNNCR